MVEAGILVKTGVLPGAVGASLHHGGHICSMLCVLMISTTGKSWGPANQGHAKEDDVSSGKERVAMKEPYIEDRYFARTTGIQKLYLADK